MSQPNNHQHQRDTMIGRTDDITISLNHPNNIGDIETTVVPFAGGTKLLNETTSTGIPAFPWKLHDVLEDAERKGFAAIISWTLNGRAFKVHDQKAFETQIMTKYFNQTQYKSFQRQYVYYAILL